MQSRPWGKAEEFWEPEDGGNGPDRDTPAVAVEEDDEDVGETPVEDDDEIARCWFECGEIVRLGRSGCCFLMAEIQFPLAEDDADEEVASVTDEDMEDDDSEDEEGEFILRFVDVGITNNHLQL